MKRFHVHVAVENLPISIQFYSQLFGMPPSMDQPDYAKWMLDEPRINFAISARGHGVGVNHFGFQADTTEELAELRNRAEVASEGTVLDQGESACCYANSEKHWTMDPQGLAWEHFLTMSDALTFGEDDSTRDGACCIPVKRSTEPETQFIEACCIPDASVSAGACCD